MAKWLQKEKAPKQEPSRERVSGGRDGGGRQGKKKSSFLVNSSFQILPFVEPAVQQQRYESGPINRTPQRGRYKNSNVMSKNSKCHSLYTKKQIKQMDF